jgi:hypothetical protein
MKLHYHFIIDIYFRQYSSAHDNEIVEFVVRRQAHDLVKGNAFWKLMENEKVR